MSFLNRVKLCSNDEDRSALEQIAGSCNGCSFIFLTSRASRRVLFVSTALMEVEDRIIIFGAKKLVSLMDLYMKRDVSVPKMLMQGN